MRSGRGLNKKRGLESLIPHKIDNEEEQEKEREKEAGPRNHKSISNSPSSDSTENAGNNIVENSRSNDGADNITNVSTESMSGSTPLKAGNLSDSVPDNTRHSSDLPAASKKISEESAENRVIMVPLTEVVPNQDQPRKDFKEEAIHELADSIRQYGVLQPLLVQKKDKYYVIVAGERRWRAAKEAGLKEVPVILKNFDDQEQMEISLIENIQREDLNAIEEAEAYRRLIDEFHLTQDEVAVKVGKSRSTVTNALRLLKLAKPVRHLLLNGDITMGHARALLAIENEEVQINASHQVIQKKLSVRETEKLVKNILNPRKHRTKPEMDEQTALAYKSIEENLQKLVGSKVQIKPQGDRGKIEIEYYSQEELERIIDMIG